MPQGTPLDCAVARQRVALQCYRPCATETAALDSAVLDLAGGRLRRGGMRFLSKLTVHTIGILAQAAVIHYNELINYSRELAVTTSRGAGSRDN